MEEEKRKEVQTLCFMHVCGEVSRCFAVRGSVEPDCGAHGTPCEWAAILNVAESTVFYDMFLLLQIQTSKQNTGSQSL